MGMTLLLACSACTKKASKPHQETPELRVLSSFSILTEMVREIGQEHVIVHNLVPVGTDPHAYKPKPDDVKFAAKADLAVYNGLNLEGGQAGWFIKLTQTVGLRASQVVPVGDSIQPRYLTDLEGQQQINPHAFISPKVGIRMAAAIRDALKAAGPMYADDFESNAGRYIDKLQDIEQQYTDVLAAIPKDKRVLFTSERAFQYLAADYDLKEGYIWAIDTDKNGTPQQLKQAIEFIQTEKPPVLFVESNVDRRPIETISSSTGVPVFEHPLYSDELSKKGGKADTYIDYLKYNLKQLQDGLQR